MAHVCTRARCDQDNSVSVIVAQTASTRTGEEAAPPVLSMSANNEEALGGRESRFWLHPPSSHRYNTDERNQRGRLFDLFDVRCRAARSYRHFGRFVSIAISPSLHRPQIWLIKDYAHFEIFGDRNCRSVNLIATLSSTRVEKFWSYIPESLKIHKL